MTLQEGYWGALAALTLLVILNWKGNAPMLRTAIVLAANCIISLAIDKLVTPFPTDEYLLSMIVVDFASAWIVLLRPAAFVQSLVGVTYLVQIGLGAGYLLGELINGYSNINHLHDGLSIMAMLQLLLVGGWFGYERIPWGRLVRRSRPGAVASHRAGNGR